jgi:hypothetical protein
MVAMAESKNNVPSIEWKISIPEGFVDLKPTAPKRFHNRVFEKILQVFGGWKSGFISLCKMAWRLGADDPRRIFHSIKVGIALALVSLFYFMHPLFESVGGMAVWAVMTVVVIFEFTAGATLYKGLNRILATLLGGLLAVGANYVADLAGHRAEPIILGAGVFLLSTSSTFARFFPKIKARHDYGVLIFILTFSFMAISGYRVDNLFEVAYRRLSTIIIGCILCILISLLICPIWAGEDLHKLIIRNLEGLAGSLEGCVTAYFKESLDEDIDNDTATLGYKCVLNSKAREESLADFARWEPAHGQFRFRYPWKQYVKIGARMRYCAYCVEALNGCLNSEIQAPYFLREHLKAPCMNIVAESSKIILELADSIKTMTRSTRIDLMHDRLNAAVEELQNCLMSQPELFIDSKRWQIVEETPEHKVVNLKVTPPSESKKPEYLGIKKAEGPAGEANKKPIMSGESKIGSREDIPVIMDDSAVAGKKNVKKYETMQGVAFMDTLPLATVACLLTEIVARLATVIVAVDELGERANFATTVDDKVIVDITNGPAKFTTTKQSPPPLQCVQNPAVVIPAGEQVPELAVESVQVKD